MMKSLPFFPNSDLSKVIKEKLPRGSFPATGLTLSALSTLVEEVARIYGLDKIPSRNLGPTAEISKADIAYDARMRLRRHLAAQGFHECTTLKLISTTQTHDELGLGMRRGETVALKNPLSEDHTHMRSSIVPGPSRQHEAQPSHGRNRNPPL